MTSKFLFLLRKVNEFLRHSRNLSLICTSDLFNKDWYLDNNPDVAQAGADPALHYLLHGGFEGRDPGPDFSSHGYWDAYEDVKKAGINPLVHYLKYGRQEGREANPRLSSPDGFLSPELKERKIFCIGANKTGTTSLETVLKDFGFRIGIQADAEMLLDEWAVRDFRNIIEYCRTADAFQDIPFSLDFTYQILDYNFPGSKFILTVRNNADEWYQSLIRFHSKLLGVDQVPTAEDVKNFVYRDKDWFWRAQQYIYGINESTLYNENIYKSYYLNHNSQILEYFKFRPQDLLVLSLSDPSAMPSLCKFLDIPYHGQVMPHLNKSS